MGFNNTNFSDKVLCSFVDFFLQKHVEFSKRVFEKMVSPASNISNFCRIRCSTRPGQFNSVSVDYNGGNLQVPLELHILGL